MHAGIDTPSVEGDRDCAGQVYLPGLREDQPGAGAIPCHCAGMGWSQPASHDHVREVRSASASEPSGGSLPLEGVPIALSTMADAVGSVCATLDPIRRLVEAHVMAAERLHGDDTTVPVLAKGKTDTGRCWIYVRDDRPFGGTRPPARANIRRCIWPDMPASCRRTPMTASTSSTLPGEIRPDPGGGVLGARKASVLCHG